MTQVTNKGIAEIYRRESRGVLATLIRVLGDFDLAEDALADAFAAAVEQWPRDGLPKNPAAWLVTTGRFKAIDRIRRKARFDASLTEVVERLGGTSVAAVEWDGEDMKDDRLRLIFTCCHPALSSEAQLALTLREVCGLTTEAIASAFLATPSTIAQRIVRAKRKIRDAGIPYEVPERRDLPERLENVLGVIYLLFNEGYSTSAGEAATRPDLTSEAIYLGRLLADLLPEPEVLGLLALMLLHESRRPARTTEQGDLILLEEQNRTLWNRELIDEGSALVRRSLESGRVDAYTLQAAIAAVHSNAESAEETDWTEIVGLYGVLLQLTESPVVELNQAVALAMRDGPAAGLARVDAILNRGELGDYLPAHAARAELCRRLGRTEAARASFERALQLTQQEPQRRYFERRLQELQN